MKKIISTLLIMTITIVGYAQVQSAEWTGPSPTSKEQILENIKSEIQNSNSNRGDYYYKGKKICGDRERQKSCLDHLLAMPYTWSFHLIYSESSKTLHISDKVYQAKVYQDWAEQRPDYKANECVPCWCENYLAAGWKVYTALEDYAQSIAPQVNNQHNKIGIVTHKWIKNNDLFQSFGLRGGCDFTQQINDDSLWQRLYTKEAAEVYRNEVIAFFKRQGYTISTKQYTDFVSNLNTYYKY
ncbi:MAG: hypothetical protein POELPBGB_02112 [Bacteroidia bacterium]|nr:hypothetical protein [Bacteroidia bacterium]